jgi:hypothetical protein
MLLFNQFSEKALRNFMPEYLDTEIEYSTNSSQTRKNQITHHLLTYQALGGATDEDWYSGHHPAWTRKAQGGVCYDLAHNPEDFRGLWRVPQDIDNSISNNICKIGK